MDKQRETWHDRYCLRKHIRRQLDYTRKEALRDYRNKRISATQLVERVREARAQAKLEILALR